MRLIDAGAHFSPDRQYRYSLWRRWHPSLSYALFIGLNPSTADECDDDPTLRRCIRFASDWGFGGVYIANLFALRATAPEVIIRHQQPIGADNNRWLKKLARNAGVIVCAWGNRGKHLSRDKACMKLLKPYQMHCLGKTKTGQPRHPLYVPESTELEGFEN